MNEKVLRGSLLTLATLSCLATLAAAAPVQKGYYEDPRYGFKIKPPAKWEPVPVPPEEQWLVKLYVADQLNFWTNPDTKYTFEHRSEMRCIAFVHAEEEDAVTSTEEAERLLEESTDIPDKITIASPFGDYEEYLDTTYSGGGFYIDEREEDDLRGVPYTRLGIRVEKLTYDGPKWIETWVFHLDGLDLAVQFEVLQEAWKKERKDVERALKSFKEIERTEPLQAQVGGWFSLMELDRGTPEERRETRTEAELAYRKKVDARLSGEWYAERMGRCYMVSHVDERYTESVAEQATTLLEWLDENLGFVGPDEYVREPVIRICKDSDEEWAFRGGSRVFLGTEIVTHKNPGSYDNYEWEWTNMQVLGLWFRERDRDLYWALPAWMRLGLFNYVRNSWAKRGEMEFRPETDERDTVRNAARDGLITPPRELIRMGNEQFGEAGDAYNRYCEAVFIVRYLFSDEARGNPLTKTLLEDYLRHMADVVAEIEAEEEAASEEDEEDEEPTTEEEEDALYKERANRWKERERRILDEVWNRTFGSWSPQDWSAFEAGYFDFIR